MSKYKVQYKKNYKILTSEKYNYVFNVKNGEFARWGETMEDDPQWSPFGPELVDMEISTICHKGCKWCYKSNTAEGKNMSFDTFKKIFDVLPDTVTQIAFGIGDVDANPDMFRMFKYCLKHLVTPNVTINGSRMTDLIAGQLASYCGAVAVSNYGPECFEAIKMLHRNGLKQVNIHQLLSAETFPACIELVKSKPDVHAIVFLSLKKRGRGEDMHGVTNEQFKELMDLAMGTGVPIGFDSCTAPKFLKMVEGHPREKYFKTVAEPCESTLFSMYIDVDGFAYPCSFTEGEMEGINVVQPDKKYFMESVWFGESFSLFRERLLKNCRRCPIHEI